MRWRGPASRIRWDRLARLSLLVVLGIVSALIVARAMSLLSIRAQAEQQLGIVRSLARENKRLAREKADLSNPATIIQDARALGMVRQGERAYVVTGLPNH